MNHAVEKPALVVKPANKGKAKNASVKLVPKPEVVLTGELKRIGEMLSYRRAHESEGEKEFIERYILPLDPAKITDAKGEVYAYIVYVDNGTGKRMNRAFCAHTDSVHNRQIPDARQTVGYDSVRGEFCVNGQGQRDCLGADDAAGCYVLLRMIEANVTGMYLFFRGEERGGIGSTYVVENHPDLFRGIEHAIQFDRRGTESIITEMMCGTTCSDTFARALGAALGMGHDVDPTGSFTDTAVLSEIVPECTNVSVGYEHEHSPLETLDGGYLCRLADSCIKTFLDPDLSLPTKRAPAEYGNRYSTPQFDLYNDVLPPELLVQMTRAQIRDRIMEMKFDEIVDALYDAGSALADMYEDDYWRH